jgi:hypothetical protein
LQGIFAELGHGLRSSNGHYITAGHSSARVSTWLRGDRY